MLWGVRTQDLNRFEDLARALSYGKSLDPEEVEAVLQATQRTHAELEARAASIAKRRIPAPPGELERYQEETKIAGLHEGVVIVALPLAALTFIGLIALTFLILTRAS